MSRAFDGLETPTLAAMLPAVTAMLDEFVAGLDDAPMKGGDEAALLELLRAAPADGREDFGRLLSLVRASASMCMETASPRYFGYVPNGGLPSAAVGDLLAGVYNRYVALNELGWGAAAMEDGVLRWMTSLFSLPETATGLLTTGGSQSLLAMAVTAREHHLGSGDLSGARVYVSEQAHRSVRKAVRLAGLAPDAIRTVPTADGRRMDPLVLSHAVEQDRAAGLRPFLVVGTAGTTNAGAVDPLREIADVAARTGLWFHVDACYGGFFQLTERGRAAMAGIELADSISVDPHKSLFLPNGTGALLVRHARLLAAAHGEDYGDYFQDLVGSELPDYAGLGGELTREHRGLRVWLPLHLHGVGAFRAALDEKLDLAGYAYDALREAGGLELPDPPELSTVVFRLPSGDEDNRALLAKIRASNRVFCTSTVLDGRMTLRLCVLAHRTHREHVDEAVRTILAALPVRA